MNLFQIGMLTMPEQNNRLQSLMEWAEITYGSGISQRIAAESPQEETEFWIALNKVKAAHDRRYQSPQSVEISGSDH